MPPRAFGELGLDEILAALGGDVGPELAPELVIEFAVTPEVARFEERRADGDVLARQAHALFERTRRVTDLEAEIPQHVQDELDDALAPRGLLERTHEQEIDIRSRRQHGPAIAAGRDDGDALGGGRVLGVIDVLGREVVEDLDQRVLDMAESLRRALAVPHIAVDIGLHAEPRIRETQLDEVERRPVQLRTGDTLCKRRQFTPERAPVEQCVEIGSLETQDRSPSLHARIEAVDRTKGKRRLNEPSPGPNALAGNWRAEPRSPQRSLTAATRFLICRHGPLVRVPQALRSHALCGMRIQRQGTKDRQGM